MQAGQTFIQTLLLQAMALYIHGPLRCKDLLGRIPNPHSRPALAAPQHDHSPRSDARSQRTPPGEIMHRSAAPHPAAAPATERPAPPARPRSDRPAASRTHVAHTHTAQIRHPAAHAGSCAAYSQPHTIRPTDSNPARNTRPSHSISRPTWKPCAGALTRCSRARPSPRRWKNSPRWKMIDPHTVRKPARLSNRTGFFFYLLRISPAECPPKPDAHLLPLRAKRGQALWTRPLGQYPPDQTVRGLHPRPAVQHADSPQGIPQPFA